ncbi:DUF6388 family protein [Vibrio cholerae]|uniref:DUF6388 family protein n=1 Tax=Vibrio TaxID=662 RepID=UPI0005B6359C|nr:MULTISPECIES: DUF6388 family protein [Vibrio]ELV8693198.1 hypothetical protein [Vibrio vulnificus]AMG02360.1 hypothetical protein AL543_04920 [Vibrio mimicus]EGR1312089.1 hypothetical protein [Vibrio cholerae]ELL1566721.1 hypothetical protein [Vibrio cholerae]KAA3490874.1 hypothetical protein Y058_19820 [Vibrio mimicus]
MLTNENYKNAYEIFLKQNSHVKTKLENLDTAISDAIGLTIDEYREKELQMEFCNFAKSNGLSVRDLVIELIARSPEEKAQLYFQERKEIEKILGV